MLIGIFALQLAINTTNNSTVPAIITNTTAILRMKEDSEDLPFIAVPITLGALVLTLLIIASVLD
jgi:hypothetical protein